MANPPALDDLVSIVLPVFNAEAYLARTIESVRGQSWRQWQLLIVIDPGTTDASARIASGFAAQDSRIQVILATLKGVSAARNCGINYARGRWLCFLDSDDLWLVDKLARQRRFMLSAGAAFSATAFRRINRDESRCGRKIHLPPKITYKRLLRQNCICSSSVMLDLRETGRPWFADVGCEDFELWLRLTGHGFDCHVLNQDLVRYRIVPGSRGSSKLRTAFESWAVLSRHLKWPKRTLVFAEFLGRGTLKHTRF